jgi:hypothetical protein
VTSPTLALKASSACVRSLELPLLGNAALMLGAPRLDLTPGFVAQVVRNHLDRLPRALRDRPPQRLPLALPSVSFTSSRPLSGDGVRLAPRQRKRVEEEIIVLFAGQAAEERFTGRPNHRGASFDYNRALTLCRLFEMHPEEEEAYLNWLGVRARLLLTGREWAWSLVEGVAAELLTRRKLTPKETREAIVAAREAAVQRLDAAHPVFGERAEETR